MRFAVEAWAPEYGAPVDGGQPESEAARVDVTVERPAAAWEPIRPAADTPVPGSVLFTDGVRRVDATVWIEGADGGSRPGVCATYAAGVVRCDGRAQVVAAAVERALFTACREAEVIACRGVAYPVRWAKGDTPEQLALALQGRMGELEVSLATAAEGDLVVVDGPLNGRQNVPGAVGFVKTHKVRYLPPELEPVVVRLGDGERTPLFLTTSSWSRFAWYLRLPGASGHAWAGVVRCEAGAVGDVASVARLADAVTAVLPRFASAGHKDARAPQNLYPIAGLERELRRRLGDPALLYRRLREAAGV